MKRTWNANMFAIIMQHGEKNMCIFVFAMTCNTLVYAHMTGTVIDRSSIPLVNHKWKLMQMKIKTFRFTKFHQVSSTHEMLQEMSNEYYYTVGLNSSISCMWQWRSISGQKLEFMWRWRQLEPFVTYIVLSCNCGKKLQSKHPDWNN